MAQCSQTKSICTWASVTVYAHLDQTHGDNILSLALSNYKFYLSCILLIKSHIFLIFLILNNIKPIPNLKLGQKYFWWFSALQSRKLKTVFPAKTLDLNIIWIDKHPSNPFRHKLKVFSHKHAINRPNTIVSLIEKWLLLHLQNWTYEPL